MIQSNYQNNKVEDSQGKYYNNQPLLLNIIVPSDRNNIQPINTQVWDFNGIRFYPNVNWNRVVCTYNLFTCELMNKVQTGELEPFWCKLLFFAQSYGKCFIPSIIMNQAK